MNKLEKEYEETEVPEEIRRKIKDDMYLEMNIDDILSELARTSKKVYLELVKNNIVSKWQKLVKKLFPNTDNLDEVLERDADYILELLVHIADNSELFAEIKDAITKENFEDLTKLTDFAVTQYTNNFNYLQGLRASLNASLKGIESFDGRYEDNREETKEFVRAKINEFTDPKYLEKKK